MNTVITNGITNTVLAYKCRYKQRYREEIPTSLDARDTNRNHIIIFNMHVSVYFGRYDPSILKIAFIVHVHNIY